MRIVPPPPGVAVNLLPGVQVPPGQGALPLGWEGEEDSYQGIHGRYMLQTCPRDNGDWMEAVWVLLAVMWYC